MASKSTVKIAVDWSKIASKLQQSEIPRLNKLKSQVDSTATKVNSLPSALPKIDWASYKARASDPKVVELIEKSYSSLKISFPKATVRSAELKKAKEDDEIRFKKFAEYAKSNIESADVVQHKFKMMIPKRDMTEEDWTLTFPRWSISDPYNPSIDPHYGRTPGLTKEEQIAFEQPDVLPYSTKTAWDQWELRKKKFYSKAL